jgi:hypothetical protein
MAAAMLEDSDSGAESCYLRHPSTQVRVASLHQYDEANRLLVSEAPRGGLEEPESRSVDFVVLLEFDLPFALLPFPVALFLLAAFGLGSTLHFAVPSNRPPSASHS